MAEQQPSQNSQTEEDNSKDGKGKLLSGENKLNAGEKEEIGKEKVSLLLIGCRIKWRASKSNTKDTQTHVKCVYKILFHYCCQHNFASVPVSPSQLFLIIKQDFCPTE